MRSTSQVKIKIYSSSSLKFQICTYLVNDADASIKATISKVRCCREATPILLENVRTFRRGVKTISTFHPTYNRKSKRVRSKIETSGQRAHAITTLDICIALTLWAAAVTIHADFGHDYGQFYVIWTSISRVGRYAADLKCRDEQVRNRKKVESY